MTNFYAPWQYVMPQLRPLFAYDILDCYGHAREVPVVLTKNKTPPNKNSLI